MGSDTDLIQSIICRELDEICDIADQEENGKLLDSNNGVIPEDALIASEVERFLNSDEDDLEKLLENRVRSIFILHFIRPKHCIVRFPLLV